MNPSDVRFGMFGHYLLDTLHRQYDFDTVMHMCMCLQAKALTRH
jgi:hypothetical protein